MMNPRWRIREPHDLDLLGAISVLEAQAEPIAQSLGHLVPFSKFCGHAFFAEDGCGHLCGYCLTMHSHWPGVCYFTEIYVLPAYREQGIAHKLTGYAMNQCQTDGMAIGLATVKPTNLPSLVHLFDLGWFVLSFYPFYYSERFDLDKARFVMAATLQGRPPSGRHLRTLSVPGDVNPELQPVFAGDFFGAGLRLTGDSCSVDLVRDATGCVASLRASLGL